MGLELDKLLNLSFLLFQQVLFIMNGFTMA